MDFIIIAGCQRSGTTLTGQILGAHSRAFLIDEPDGLYPWFDAWINKSADLSAISALTIKKAAAKYTDHRRNFTELSDLDNMVLVLKAPNLTYSFEELSQLTPQPKIVYPVRDVRSVAASMMRLAHIKMVENQTKRIQARPKVAALFAEELQLLTDSAIPKSHKCAVVWTIKTGLHNKFSEAGLQPFVFRYEDLVRAPSAYCKRITEFCGIPFEPSQLDFHKVMSGNGPGNTSRKRNIDSASVDKWREDLSPDEVHSIVDVGKSLLTQFGYSL